MIHDMYTVRRAQHSDAQGIIESLERSIREVCRKDYTTEQIEVWAGRRLRPNIWHQVIDRDFIWVAELNHQISGFAHLAVMDNDTGELMGLYLMPEACGQGVGKALLTTVKNEAYGKGVRKLQLHSTLTARTFYESSGFRQIDGKCSVEIRGVDIPCIPMECPLTRG